MTASPCGCRIVSTGMAVPPTVLTNADLEQMMDTSDEWIIQRTGVRTRYRSKPELGEDVAALSVTAVRAALEEAKIAPAALDLVILATCTPDMTCPATASRVAGRIGAVPGGSFDILAACSGFVYGLNIADSLIRQGGYRTIAMIGADSLTRVADYTNRKVSVLSGDGAGVAIVQRVDDPSRGCLFQSMYSDGRLWDYLYIPQRDTDAPSDVDWNETKLNYLQMKGREVFKFAVTKFPEALEEALGKAGVRKEDVAMIIAHQSNARIIEATRKRLDMPEDRFYVNIDRYGNTSAASVPICLHELRQAGRVGEGDIVVFVAMGGGMTWGTSVWRL